MKLKDSYQPYLQKHSTGPYSEPGDSGAYE
jgi:hypothetical protein